MATIGHRGGKRAKKAIGPLHETRAADRDASQATLEQVSDAPLECCERRGGTVHGVACACEQFIAKRPLRSIIVAGGIGWLLGRVWKAANVIEPIAA